MLKVTFIMLLLVASARGHPSSYFHHHPKRANATEILATERNAREEKFVAQVTSFSPSSLANLERIHKQLFDDHDLTHAHPRPQICFNVHGDFGFCTEELQCEVTKGIEIGVCTLRGQAGADTAGTCCYHLPCSTQAVEKDALNMVMQFGLRNSRSSSEMRGFFPSLLEQAPISSLHAACGRPVEGRDAQVTRKSD